MWRENSGEPRDLQDSEGARGADYLCERGVVCAESFEAAYEDSQAGRVEEVNAAEVGDDVHGALGGQVPYPLAKDRHGVNVDLAGDLEDGAVAAWPDGFQVEFLHCGSRRPSVMSWIDKESCRVTVGRTRPVV